MGLIRSRGSRDDGVMVSRTWLSAALLESTVSSIAAGRSASSAAVRAASLWIRRPGVCMMLGAVVRRDSASLATELC